MTGLGSDKSKKSHRNDSHFEPLCADVNTHHLEKTLSKPEFSGVKTNLHFSHNATSFNINVALQKNLYKQVIWQQKGENASFHHTLVLPAYEKMMLKFWHYFMLEKQWDFDILFCNTTTNNDSKREQQWVLLIE